jgi:hypothetical protein
MCDRQSGTGTGFSPGTSLFPCHDHFTSASYCSVMYHWYDTILAIDCLGGGGGWNLVGDDASNFSMRQVLLGLP